MPPYRLTVRHGPQVDRDRFATLDEAIAELRRRAEAIRSEGGLDAVTMLREFEPRERVHARLEISTGRLLRGRDAGIDVMGDGSLVAYRGGVFRKPIDSATHGDAYEAVHAALAGH